MHDAFAISSEWLYFPDINFGVFIVYWDLYGLIGFHGLKGSYTGAFLLVVQANKAAGTKTAHGRPKCQHITEHAGMLTCATQDFVNFYSAKLANRPPHWFGAVRVGGLALSLWAFCGTSVFWGLS